MSDDIDKYNAEIDKYNAEIDRDAQTIEGARKAGTIGHWFGLGVFALCSAAMLAVVALVLFAAVRGIGSWLEVW